MKNSMKLLAVSISAAVLAGCGGGSDEPSTSTDTGYIHTGKVVNIANANVFFDVNQNGERDQGEPSSMSDEQGNYSFEVPRTLTSCLEYTPIIAKVTTDSTYVDSGLYPLGEYNLALAPKYVKSPIITNQNITALTTMEWSNAPLSVTPEGSFKSCENIGSSDSTIDDVYAYFDQQQVVLETKAMLQDKYNVTSSEIKEDYIKTNNTQVKSLSEKILTGLEKTESIKNNFESNNSSNKNKIGFMIADSSGNTWNVFNYSLKSDRSYNYEKSKYNDDLSVKIDTLEKFDRDYIESGSGFYFFEEVFKDYANNECIATEFLIDTVNTSSSSSKEYDYAKNIAIESSVSACSSVDFLTESDYRILGEYSSYPEGLTKSYIQRTQAQTAFLQTGNDQYTYNLKDNAALYEDETNHNLIRSSLDHTFVPYLDLCDTSVGERHIDINYGNETHYTNRNVSKTETFADDSCSMTVEDDKYLVVQTNGEVDIIKD